MAKEHLTPRERWQAVLSREQPDRVPVDYWSTPEFSAKLVRHMGLSRKTQAALVRDLTSAPRDPRLPNEGRRALREALKRLGVDFVVGASPRYIGPKLPPNTDVFGCTYRAVNYGTGEYSEVVTHPLAQYRSVEEIRRGYRWPNPDWYDYSIIPEVLAGWEDYPVRGGGSEPFLIYKNLRGDEQAMVDLVENPEMVHYILDQLFHLALTDTQRIYETIPGRVMLTYVAEDMGGQERLMFSPRHIRAYLLPRMQRVIELAHQAGAYAFHHNDGNCRAILPDMVSLGIDMLNPIQWRSPGMERESLKAEFGERLVFHGAMDNQYTLPFGSVAEVRQEVADNLRILGAGGGYILAPCHNIQPVSPVENIIAMYETAREIGAC